MFESTFHGITGLSHTGFYAENVERTIEFYTKVLGAKVEWVREGGNGPICKLYVGEIGLSIPQQPAGKPKQAVPFAVHFAFKVRPEMADECIEHVKSCGIEVDGPNGHPLEGQNLSWFFSDPDGHRLEIEAHYPTVEEAVAVLERDRALRRPELGLYQGGDALPELKEAQTAKATQGV